MFHLTEPESPLLFTAQPEFPDLFCKWKTTSAKITKKGTPTICYKRCWIWVNFLDISMLRYFRIFCGRDILEKSEGLVSASRNHQKAELFNGMEGNFQVAKEVWMSETKPLFPTKDCTVELIPLENAS